MQLAKIRRKARVVKKKFHEIWKIAVDLGGFGARRSGRRGAGVGRRRGAWRRRGSWRWRAGRRGGWQARRGRWAATRLVAVARGTAGRVQGARRARGGGQNHASSPHPSDEPPRARSFSHPDGISDESDAFWAFMRFAAAQFDQSQAKSPSPAPNPVYSHPFCRIAECGPDLDDGEVQRRSNRREGDDTRGRGDARGRCTRAMHEDGAMHEGDVRGRCTRTGAMRGRCTRTMHKGDAGAEHDEAAARGRNAAPKYLERSANQRIAQSPRRRTQPNRNNSVWRRLKSGFWIRTRIPRCRPILHAIRAISTGLSS